MSAGQLFILGTRGIPARHGGFETFAERLALHLTRRDWKVTVYCQGEVGQTETIEDTWNGVQRIIVPVTREGALGTMEFDWKSVHSTAERKPALVLTLGYNTAVFCTYLRWKGIPNLINMDGLEWRREKWKFHERMWLWFNERVGCWTGNHLIADHPVIAKHLATRVSSRKITTIPYGADPVRAASPAPLEQLGIQDTIYGLVIARPEPENSVLEIVTAFSRRPRNAKLVVLGKYDSEIHSYHRAVLEAASDEVVFPGAIYDQSAVRALRRHAHFYVHGHRVGGTNPSLVEALGAGNAVVAHDNAFNRWVAGPEARFFVTEVDCDMHISALLGDPATARAMGEASTRRFESAFRWDSILAQYEALLHRHIGDGKRSMPVASSLAHGVADRNLALDVLAGVSSTTSGMVTATSGEPLESKVK